MLDEASKYNPELSKEDLLRLLACLQSELEARDVVIGALKSERQGLINFKAKYGISDFEKSRPSLVDPYEALQRDSMIDHCHNSADKSDLRQYYDSQISQLESLINTQRHAQEKIREQLNFMEKKYMKVRGELEEEKRKHEHETAQGDDVLVMLEKERERLKSEVDCEKLQNKKLEKDLKRLIHAWKEQSLLLARQKEVTISLLIERRRYAQRLSKSENVADQKPQIGCVDSSIQTSCSDEDIGSPICNGDIDGSCTNCVQSSMLRESLEVEIARRNEVELNYEQLKEGYEKLLQEVNLLRYSKLATPIDIDIDDPGVTSTGDVDTKLVQSTSSVGVPLRTKPHPPTRRSSEVSNTTVPQSPVSPTALVPSVNSLPADERLVNMDEADCKGTTDVSPSKLDTDKGGFPVDSSSRSSTPSPPPPPPPPVQLHYPYPGMQSHLQNSPRRVSATSNSEVFFPRPISSHVSTSAYAVVRPRAPPPSISNPSSYGSLNSCSLVRRMNSPSTSVRPTAYRAPVSVNFQQQNLFPQTPVSHPTTLVSGSELSMHAKTPLVTAVAPVALSQRRKSPLPGTSQSQTQAYSLVQHQTHPFSPYSPTRYHHHARHPHRYPTGGGVGVNSSGGNSAIVSSSTSVTAASHGVRTIRPGLPEHVCISGK